MEWAESIRFFTGKARLGRSESRFKEKLLLRGRENLLWPILLQLLWKRNHIYLMYHKTQQRNVFH